MVLSIYHFDQMNITSAGYIHLWENDFPIPHPFLFALITTIVPRMSFYLFYVRSCWSITNKTRQFNLCWVVVAFNVNRTLLKSAHFSTKSSTYSSMFAGLSSPQIKSDCKRNRLKRFAQPAKNWPKLSRPRLKRRQTIKV